MSAKSWCEENGQIVLRLSRADYSGLLIMLGYAAGSAFAKDRRMAYGWVELLNRINRDNPGYTPYEVPEEFRDEGKGNQG